MDLGVRLTPPLVSIFNSHIPPLLAHVSILASAFRAPPPPTKFVGPTNISTEVLPRYFEHVFLGILLV